MPHIPFEHEQALVLLSQKDISPRTHCVHNEFLGNLNKYLTDENRIKNYDKINELIEQFNIFETVVLKAMTIFVITM